MHNADRFVNHFNITLDTQETFDAFQDVVLNVVTSEQDSAMLIWFNDSMLLMANLNGQNVAAPLTKEAVFAGEIHERFKELYNQFPDLQAKAETRLGEL